MEYTQPTHQQPVVVVTQPQPVQPVIYHQPIQTVVTQPQIIPQQQQQPYNPHAMQPGVLVINQPQQPQQVPVQSDTNMSNNNEVDYDELRAKGKQAAIAAGKLGKKAGVAAIGWMAKKMNEINEKVQDDQNKNMEGEGQEGQGENKKTY